MLYFSSLSQPACSRTQETLRYPFGSTRTFLARRTVTTSLGKPARDIVKGRIPSMFLLTTPRHSSLLVACREPHPYGISAPVRKHQPADCGQGERVQAGMVKWDGSRCGSTILPLSD